ncbi:MAG: chloride channel protein [Solirubrobacterales bacterium]|nr:chloride channel protein [Solirubrobacterales bacterium]
MSATDTAIDTSELPSPLKTIILAIPFALLGSLIATAFLWAEEHLINLVWTDLPDALGMTEPAWWLVVLLPLIGAAMVMLAWRLPGKTSAGPLEGLHFDITPKIFGSVILAAAGTLVFGLVLGPEAPLLACGTAAGAFVLRRQPPTVIKFGMLMTALAAIAAIFGNPIAVMVLLAEFGALGIIPVAALMPGFVTLGVAYVAETGIGSWTGLGSSTLAIPGLPEFTSLSVTDLLVALAVGLVAALLTLVARKFGERVAVMARSKPYIVLIGVALLTSGLAIAVREITGDSIGLVLFSGQQGMPELLTQTSLGAVVVIIAAKMIAYGGALGAGYRGGPIFPAVFLGVGVAVAGALIIPAASVTGLIVAAVAAAVTAALRAPFTATVLALMLATSAGAGATASLAIFGAAIGFLLRVALDHWEAAHPPSATAAASASA